MTSTLSKRKINRLKEYDYSQNGCYFVTVCTESNNHTLGKIVGADDPGRPTNVQLSPLGKCLEETIKRQNKDNIKIDCFVVMPNHFHAIVEIDDSGRPRSSAPTVGNIVGNIKSYVSKLAGFSVWQKGFHDHIIRCDNSYEQIAGYILTNPDKWAEDKYY